MYTPLKEIEYMPQVPYQPVYCKGTCKAILNPFARIDYNAKIWICPFCFQRNQFPAHYADISETNRPAELIPEYTTIEYIIGQQAPPPVFLFVVDLCLTDVELQNVKNSLIQVVGLLPPQALVGLITYGTMVQVHELGFSECPKSYVFRGSRDYTAQAVQDMLGLRLGVGGLQPGAQHPGAQQQGQQGQQGQAPVTGAYRFLQPVSECEFTLTSVLEELQCDPWPVKGDQRPLRATGTALAIGIGLMESSFKGQGGRIMLITGGPCTSGPGAIVSPDKKEAIRTHHHLNNNINLGLHKSATKFYQSLAQRCVDNCHSVDMFCGALDQVGLLEMADLCTTTSGYLVMSEDFAGSTSVGPIFKESFRKIFDKNDDGQLKFGLNATIEIQTSREFKVQGVVGPVASLGKKGPCVGETEIGVGGTTAWRCNTLNQETTLAFFFEIANPHSNPVGNGSQRHMQIITQYQHPNGTTRMRVTTLNNYWIDGSDPQTLGRGFDQEASAALMARLAVYRAESEDSFDILRWLDRSLIRMCAKFGEYQKDQPSSFSMNESMSIYPQFMFHLRRSPFLQVFNASPDETVVYRYALKHANVTDSLIMIQPTLMAYSFNGPPEPVLLDVTSVAPDRILLLDTFFCTLIFHGETIASWRRDKFQDKEGYENFKELLEAPQLDAREIVKSRFPIPRWVDCDQGGSQARFLMSKLNPSLTHNNAGGNQAVVISDDVSLQVFTDHLKRLAVTGQTN
eukprot:TRINITY_DN1449_c0_g1_i1.p1 TRINITY_DN1449_c0_g1~~TRINITY_DN1449_c0_g1_i1.p1  ORF type:complete len:739 (-),score=224.20 TRINITY_DN1449_c0_g1_i1:330-2546(-)